MKPHAVIASFLVSWPAAALAAPAFELQPCSPPGVAGEARCGTFEVFENRAARNGRKIGLAVILLPATGSAARPEPAVPVSGGPGDSVVKLAARFSHDPQIRSRQPMLLVDVRGTGQSNGLFCRSMMGEKQVQDFLDEFLPADGVRACLEEWRGKADLSQYTTANIVDDLEELRLALGLPKLDLEGGSYGTRVVLEYLRRHPEGVRTAVIEGVVPPDARLPLHFARDAQTALDAVFAACARDAACHEAFPDPAADLRSVLERLRREPVTTTAIDSATGRPIELRLSSNGLAQVLRYSLYLPSTSAQVPMILRAAARGDFRPIAELATFWGGVGVQLADGMFLSVTCSEDVAFIDEAEIAAAAAGTFMGDFRVRRQRAACALWDVAPVPRTALEPVRSDLPVLVVSGEWDPVTPARDGERVAATLANGRHMVVPGGGHGTEGMTGTGECLASIRDQFLARASVAGLDTSCLARVSRPAWVLRWTGEDRVVLAATELDQYTGSFASEHGVLEVKREEDRLRFLFGGLPPLWLQPMKGERFQVIGLPDGFLLEAVRDDTGRLAGFRFYEGGAEASIFSRQPL